MNNTERITIIQLLTKELCETATQFEKAKKTCSYPVAGIGDITSDNCRTALQRRITTLRAELLKLSKEL